MAVITSVNRARFMQEEMDRRSGIKPTVKQANPYADLSRSELKAHKEQIKEILKETKAPKAPKE